MSGGVIFEYRCSKCSAVTERRHPPGTEYEKHEQIICPKCLEEKDKAEYAYLIFARAEK